MYGPTLGPATLFSNRNPLFTMQSHAPLWLRLALKVRWKVWFRKNTFRPNFASLDRINPWPPIFDIKQLHMFFLQALMNLFETTILLEKMHLSTFKKSHFLPQLEVLRAIHVPSIFWVATPEVKTRNATARAQEKKVSGPGNRIARSMAVWSCSWNPEKWSYSSWLRDYLVITNCYIPLIIWSDSLSSSPITQLNPNKIFPNSNQIHIFLQRIHQSCAHLSYVCHGSSFWKSSCACVMILKASIASMVRLIWAMSSACKVQWIKN